MYFPEAHGPDPRHVPSLQSDWEMHGGWIYLLFFKKWLKMAEPFESPKLQDFDCISMQTPRERFQAALNFFRNSFPNAPYSSSTVNFDGNSYRHESTFSSAIKSRTIQHTNDCSDVLLQNQVTVPSNPVHLLHSTGLPLLAGTIVIAPSLVVQDTLTCHALQVLVNNPLIGDVHVDPLSVTAVLVPNILIDKRGIRGIC